MWVLLLLCAVSWGADLKITANFAGGNVGQVQRVSEWHWRVGVKGQSDQDGRNRQANWYYFRVEGARRGHEIVIDLVDLPGEYNYENNRGAVTGDTRPYWRDKGEWKEAEGDYDPAEPKWRLRFQPKGRAFTVAHLEPYLAKNLDSLRKDLKPEVETIGKSVGGRKIELWTVDRSGGRTGAPVVWMMFRQHAWEAGTSWTGDGFMRHLPDGVVWKLLPLNDPDGVASGGVRFNRHGYDLNRNWDSPYDVVKRPEILAQKKAMEAWLEAGNKIDFFLSIHNTETGEYLEGPPEGPGQDLWKALKDRTSFDPDRAYFTRMAVTAPGRANVIQWLWGVKGVPAHLMELRVARSPKLEARPTAESWRVFGEQLSKEIAAVLIRPR